MLWTAKRLETIRMRAVDATQHLLVTQPQLRPINDLIAEVAVCATFALLGAATYCWTAALTRYGAPPLRPAHALIVELVDSMNDPLLGVSDSKEDL